MLSQPLDANDFAPHVGRMKLFSCEHCDAVLFFENTSCVNCGHAVGFRADIAALVSLDNARGWRLCRNGAEADACNWLVRAEGGPEYCGSCLLTEIRPDLDVFANRQAWLRIEAAKRRLLYTLQALKLPVISKQNDSANGLAFRFLQGSEEKPVMTGHEEGVITLNVAEADFAFRENMREKMGEGYRTVLGHLRHEIGHYYWDRLVRGGKWLQEFRMMFGDEQASYEDAVHRHYEQGAPANWGEQFVSAYASMHPWEDWAETWAHYLHMVDTLETAKSHGLTVRMPNPEATGERVALDRLAFADFNSLSAGWNAVTLAMNSLNRSMGMKDAYPFVLSARVLEKLRFVHDRILAQVREAAQMRTAAA
jgi:hypothetical protein